MEDTPPPPATEPTAWIKITAATPDHLPNVEWSGYSYWGAEAALQDALDLVRINRREWQKKMAKEGSPG